MFARSWESCLCLNEVYEQGTFNYRGHFNDASLAKIKISDIFIAILLPGSVYGGLNTGIK